MFMFENAYFTVPLIITVEDEKRNMFSNKTRITWKRLLMSKIYLELVLTFLFCERRGEEM